MANTFAFEQRHLDKINKTLNSDAIIKGNSIRYEIKNVENNLQMNLEIYNSIDLGNHSGCLINIYTNYGIHQLHHCTGFLASEMLGEVIFIAETENYIDAVVVEQNGGYNIYSNVDKKLLSGDFTQMSPEIMMTGVTLSIIEPLLNGGNVDDFLENEE